MVPLRALFQGIPVPEEEKDMDTETESNFSAVGFPPSGGPAEGSTGLPKPLWRMLVRCCDYKWKTGIKWNEEEL